MQQHWEVRGWLRYASSYCPMSSNNTLNMALQLVYSSLHNKKCRAYYNSTEHITIAQNKNKQNSCGLSLLSFRKFRPLSSMKKHSTQCFSHTHSDIAHQMFPASWVLCGYLYSQKDKSLWLSVDSHMLYAQCSCSICYRLLNSPAQKLAPFSKKTSPLWRKIFLKKKKRHVVFRKMLEMCMCYELSTVLTKFSVWPIKAQFICGSEYLENK